MKKKLAVIGGIAGGVVALLGSAALAFILVTGVGSSSAEAYQVKNLVVTHQTPVIIPGQRLNVAVTVANPNPYPVRLTGLDADVNAPRECKIHAVALPFSGGGHAAVAPAGGNTGSGPGVPPTGDPRVVPANGQITLQGKVLVEQHSSADLACAYTLTVGVQGELGNG